MKSAPDKFTPVNIALLKVRGNDESADKGIVRIDTTDALKVNSLEQPYIQMTLGEVITNLNITADNPYRFPLT